MPSLCRTADDTAMNIAEALKLAKNEFLAADSGRGGRDAVLLLMHATGRGRTLIYSHPEYVLSDEEERKFLASLKRRCRREPIQYITGFQEFYGFEFEVTPDVLIPRPETELLVEYGSRALETSKDKHFLEVGVGSGCVSIAILKMVPDSRCTAVDISPQAIEVARRNAISHGVPDRIELIQSDLFEAVEGSFDVLISNPPYIPRRDLAGLMAEVRDFEPHSALDGGEDGLQVIRRLAEGAPAYLRKGGSIFIEVGAGQASAVASLLENGPFSGVSITKDLAGIGRMVSAVRR